MEDHKCFEKPNRCRNISRLPLRMYLRPGNISINTNIMYILKDLFEM